MNPPFSRHRSPGSTTTRLMKTSPKNELHANVPVLGMWKATMSPRRGSRIRYTTRETTTRSCFSASQPAAGFAQWSVGSMAELGTLYSLDVSSTATTRTAASRMRTSSALVSRRMAQRKPMRFGGQ